VPPTTVAAHYGCVGSRRRHNHLICAVIDDTGFARAAAQNGGYLRTPRGPAQSLNVIRLRLPRATDRFGGPLVNRAVQQRSRRDLP
jgi:hypothetical protein